MQQSDSKSTSSLTSHVKKLADLYFFQIDNLPNLVFFQKI